MQTARFEHSNRAVMVIGRSFLSQKPLEGGRRLECRNVVSRNYNRRVLHDITALFLLAAFNQEGSEAAEVNVFLTNLGCTHLFHRFLDNGRNGYGLDARFPGDLLYDICFDHVL